MKKIRLISLILIIVMALGITSLAAPRIPVYKVGNVLYFLDKASGTITGFAGEPTDLVIPTSLGGYNVVSIGTGAFSGASTLKTLSIPDGISTVSANAFASCPNLTSLQIASSVSYIGSRAFADCTSLKNVIFDASPAIIEADAFENTSWLSGTSSEFVIFGDTLYKYNGTSVSVKVPDNVKSIASSAFAYNSAVKEIILPDGLVKIGDNAFVHCYSLEKIVIPKTVSHIGAGAFDDTIFLHKMQGDFAVINGILVSYKGSSPHVEVPYGVTAIGAGAFMANEFLLSVHLPQSVVYIDSMAFGGCSRMLLINIPQSVEWIDEYAFSSCYKLTLYTFAGTYGQSYAEYMQMPSSAEVYVSYNGEKVYFDTVVPVIYSDRTYLPLRSLMEMMGYSVEWDEVTRIVTCKKEDRIAVIEPDGKITVDGVEADTSLPPININGSNLVSARIIAEALSARINWNADLRTVEIIY